MSPAQGHLGGVGGEPVVPEAVAGQLGGTEAVGTEANGTAAAAADAASWTTLELDPLAARRARRWIAAALADWPDERVETARLLASELVTNAVLHAGTPIQIRLRRDGSRARVEIADGHRGGPLPKHFEPDAVTGRGLWLLASLAEDWGVTRTDGGKVVWFIIDATSSAPVGPAALVADPALATSVTGTGTGTIPHDETKASSDLTEHSGPSTAGRTVTLRRIPLAVYREAEEHNDALLRELSLITQFSTQLSTAGPQRPPLPSHLRELAEEVRHRFRTATSGLRAQVEQALRQGETAVDLVLVVPDSGPDMFFVLVRQLDELDRYCARGDLLTLASSPTLRRFRRWSAQQVSDQLAGRPPEAWRQP